MIKNWSQHSVAHDFFFHNNKYHQIRRDKSRVYNPIENIVRSVPCEKNCFLPILFQTLWAVPKLYKIWKCSHSFFPPNISRLSRPAEDPQSHGPGYVGRVLLGLHAQHSDAG